MARMAQTGRSWRWKQRQTAVRARPREQVRGHAEDPLAPGLAQMPDVWQSQPGRALRQRTRPVHARSPRLQRWRLCLRFRRQPCESPRQATLGPLSRGFRWECRPRWVAAGYQTAARNRPPPPVPICWPRSNGALRAGAPLRCSAVGASVDCPERLRGI